jgi:hypothetical protein
LFLNPTIICYDGFSLSVQASPLHYCLPQNDVGPWTHLEINKFSPLDLKEVDLLKPFRSKRLPPIIGRMEDSYDNIIPLVPYKVIKEIIWQHGGIFYREDAITKISIKNRANNWPIILDEYTWVMATTPLTSGPTYGVDPNQSIWQGNNSITPMSYTTAQIYQAAQDFDRRDPAMIDDLERQRRYSAQEMQFLGLQPPAGSWQEKLMSGQWDVEKKKPSKPEPKLPVITTKRKIDL